VRASSVPFVISGGPGNFQPSSKPIKPLKAGLKVDGDGNGRGGADHVRHVKLLPRRLGPARVSPVSGFNKYEFPVVTRQTVHFPFPPIPPVLDAVKPFPTQFGGGFP